MSLKNNLQTKAKKKVQKVAFKVLKPFLPFIIIIIGLFFAFCTIIDAIFVQEVQSDNFSMSEEQLEIKNMCISKAEYLNTCNNFKDEQSTNELLDVDNREDCKLIEWSHLYAIMAFHNMTDNSEMNKKLLDEVSIYFKSTFKYETNIVKVETITKDENGNYTIEETEQIQYLLVESDSIMGHYKYNYEEKIIENSNTKTTKKVFVGEELIGIRHERLRKYLKERLNISESDIDTDVEIIIQASNGYYDGKENTNWLQANSPSNIVITNGKSLVPTGMFIWPVPNYTNISSHFGMRIHPITRSIQIT